MPLRSSVRFRIPLPTMTDLTEVRRAELDDIPFIVELLWNTEKPGIGSWSGVMTNKPNLEHLAESLRRLMLADNTVVFFTENAVIAGEVRPSFVNYSIKIATEQLFRSNGLDGDKLLKRFEKWAWDMGATHVGLNITEAVSLRPDTQEAFLIRSDYIPIEKVWKKRLV